MTFRRLLLLIAILIIGCRDDTAPLTEVGRPAPGFRLSTIDGGRVELGRLSGRVIVLDFWATWCAPCKESTLEMERLHRRYKDRGLVVIGISMDKGVQAVKDFVAGQKITYTIAMDDGRVSTAFGVTRIPATYVLDRRHIIVSSYRGYAPEMGGRLSLDIEKLL